MESASDSIAQMPSSISKPIKYLFFIGCSGSGKSSCVNLCLDLLHSTEDKAPVGVTHSVTLEVNAYEANDARWKLVLIDTPGLNDTRAKGIITNKKIFGKIAHKIMGTMNDDTFTPQVGAFIFVINPLAERLPMQQLLLPYENLYGKGIYAKLIIVYTHQDYLIKKIHIEKQKIFVKDVQTFLYQKNNEFGFDINWDERKIYWTNPEKLEGVEDEVNHDEEEKMVQGQVFDLFKILHDPQPFVIDNFSKVFYDIDSEVEKEYLNIYGKECKFSADSFRLAAHSKKIDKNLSIEQNLKIFKAELGVTVVGGAGTVGEAALGAYAILTLACPVTAGVAAICAATLFGVTLYKRKKLEEAKFERIFVENRKKFKGSRKLTINTIWIRVEGDGDFRDLKWTDHEYSFTGIAKTGNVTFHVRVITHPNSLKIKKLHTFRRDKFEEVKKTTIDKLINNAYHQAIETNE